MMQAVVSGQAGLAFLVEGDTCRSLGIDSPERLADRHPADFPRLVAGAGDLLFLTDTDLPTVIAQLGQASDEAEALQLALILLDADLSIETREECAGALEELLDRDGVREHLYRILYAHEAPDCADWEGALSTAELADARPVRDLVMALCEHQQAIREVRVAWEAIPLGVFNSGEAREAATTAVTRAGLFRRLAVIRATDGDLNAFRLEFGLSDARRLPNQARIAAAWVQPLRALAAAPARADYDDLAAAFQADEAQGEARDGDDRVPSEVFEEVERRKQEATWQMQRGDVERALVAAEDLAKYQLGTGRARHASNSLCAIASEAGKLDLPPLRLQLADRSLALNPANGWAHTERGYACLAMGQFEDAMEAFEHGAALGSEQAEAGRVEVLRAQGQFHDALACAEEVVRDHPELMYARYLPASITRDMGLLEEALTMFGEAARRYPDDPVGPTGGADVLRRMGRLEEALRLYDATAERHRHSVHVRTGRAEVLKELGRLDDALRAYHEIVERHPQLAVARAGRAEVLKEMGRLDDALRAYQDAMQLHQHNIIVRNGHAEVLKEMGRLGDALQAYEETILRHPYNVVARNGRATVLLALGEPAKAIAALPSGPPADHESWIGYHIRGMILLKMGELEAAEAVFHHGVAHDPWPADRDYFRSGLALARLRQRQYAPARAVLADVTNPSLAGPANVLRLHAFGAEGELEQAAGAYESLSPASRAAVHELAAELRRRFLTGEEPLHDDEWILDAEISLLLPLAA